MTDEELINFDKRGWIPGPQEDEIAFLERIVKKTDIRDSIPEEDWKEARASTEQLFDFSPEAVVAIYSNKGLRPWEGAAVWLGDRPLIQLRIAFQKGSFLKTYKRGEVLSHEAVHFARIKFDEPRFEEIFAFQTSKQSWRKRFGPLFRTPNETLIFLFGMGASLLGILFFSEIFLLFPFALLAFFSVRLAWTYSTFNNALKKIKKIASQKEALSILFRLTDQEISYFAKASEEQIHHYRRNQTSLRWRLLNLRFIRTL